MCDGNFEKCHRLPELDEKLPNYTKKFAPNFSSCQDITEDLAKVAEATVIKRFVLLVQPNFYLYSFPIVFDL